MCLGCKKESTEKWTAEFSFSGQDYAAKIDFNGVHKEITGTGKQVVSFEFESDIDEFVNYKVCVESKDMVNVKLLIDRKTNNFTLINKCYEDRMLVE